MPDQARHPDTQKLIEEAGREIELSKLTRAGANAVLALVDALVAAETQRDAAEQALREIAAMDTLHPVRPSPKFLVLGTACNVARAYFAGASRQRDSQ